MPQPLQNPVVARRLGAWQSRLMRRAPSAECPVLAHAPGGVPRTSRPLARARLMVERAKEARPVPVTSELLGFTQPVISHHAKILVGELGMQAGLVVLHGRGRARPGARCAYRMALDHPATVARLAVLDIVPTGEAF